MKIGSICGSMAAMLLLLLLAASLRSIEAESWREIKEGLYTIEDSQGAVGVQAATFTSRKGRKRVNATVTHTFGWADIRVDSNEGARSCQTACNAYGLVPVGSNGDYLCAYNSTATGTRVLVYGTQAADADPDTCRAATSTNAQTDSASENVGVYVCGCCGRIQPFQGAPFACPAKGIYEVVPSNATCSSAGGWTAPFGTGNSICLRTTSTTPKYGTIYSNGTACNIWDRDATPSWSRVCLKVNIPKVP